MFDLRHNESQFPANRHCSALATRRSLQVFWVERPRNRHLRASAALQQDAHYRLGDWLIRVRVETHPQMHEAEPAAFRLLANKASDVPFRHFFGCQTNNKRSANGNSARTLEISVGPQRLRRYEIDVVHGKSRNSEVHTPTRLGPHRGFVNTAHIDPRPHRSAIGDTWVCSRRLLHETALRWLMYARL